ncbi:conjugal transfer protein TrbH [Pseudomonas sp. WS 5096]|uniref:Conjugal transfer protein TrbH n=1 Tax=Pseudomonas cremoris TaxID=2724178 RepID=A0ABR6THC9_9PSED|nr:conjugal transfer protein TrbH [Pseudomonas cremoris]MBC2385350.1 conjugal transfer protein TrbH [Pseudomonas cremoris]
MRIFVTILAVVMLAGCAGKPYGTFVETSVGFQSIIAIDAVNQMANLYPPASTRLSLALEPKDGFGQVLIQQMRLSGYAVYESATVPLAGGKMFAYVLDNLDSANYRVSISVGSETLSRTYAVGNHNITPNGLWTRKE